MIAVTHPGKLAAGVLAASILVCCAAQAQRHAPPSSASPPSKSKPPEGGTSSASKKLVGSWQPKGARKGATAVFLPDGTGKNADGSRFTWRLEGDYFVAQALSKDGKPTGMVSRIPILFTRDGKEYATFLEQGRLKTPFYRLLPSGQIDKHRTKAGGQYLPNKFLPKRTDEDEENAPTPNIHPAKPQGTPSPPPATLDKDRSGAKRAALPPVSKLEARPATAAIYVGANVHVSSAWPRVPHAEVTLTPDPVQADWLVAGSMFSPPPYDAASPKIVVYASRDGGKTWKVSLERKNPNPQTYADPAFACGPSGLLYFVNMYWPALDAQSGMALQFTRTGDGGKTWTATTRITGLHDRPFLAVDTSSGPRRGWLYCTAGHPDRSVFVSKDQGQSFLPPVTWSEHPHETGQMGNPVVTSEGTLVLLYTTVPGKQEVTTAGDTAADPDAVAAGTAVPEPPTAASSDVPGSVAVVRSQDGGMSFQGAQQIASYRRGSGRGGLPMLAIDPESMPYKDRLYAVWLDMPASGSRVMLAYSKDGGITWSDPILLSEQPSGKSGDHRETQQSYEAFLPCVAVNKAGVVSVSWYDTRGLPPKQAGWNLRFRASLDGGETWLPSVRVSEVSTLYTTGRKKRFPTETRGMYFQPGHTAGLAADAKGIFHPLWIDGRTGVRQVFTAAVRVAGKPSEKP